MRLVIIILVIFGTAVASAEQAGVSARKTYKEQIFFYATMQTHSWDQYNAITYSWVTSQDGRILRHIGPVTKRENRYTKIAGANDYFIYVPQCGCFTFQSKLGYPSRFFNTNNGVSLNVNKIATRFYTIECEVRAMQTSLGWGGGW